MAKKAIDYDKLHADRVQRKKDRIDALAQALNKAAEAGASISIKYQGRGELIYKITVDINIGIPYR